MIQSRPTRKVSRRPAISSPGRGGWLLLIYQLPANPSNARVGTWRRLQDLGAVALKNSVYVLPNNPQAREDFEWIKTEIAGKKGRASVLIAGTLDTATEQEIIAAFRGARQTDYESVKREAEKLLKKLRSAPGISPVRQRAGRVTRALRERWGEIRSIDFYQAPGGSESAAILDALDLRLARKHSTPTNISEVKELLMPEKFHSRTWVTRPRPGIDRMASAWLIRSFIDPKAKFVFADKPEEIPAAVPFDMYGVQFSHQGNQCTFETLGRLFNIHGAAIERLAQIVHNLDLKDELYQVPEEAVVGRLVEGLRQLHADDGILLEKGMEMFEALYRSFEKTPQGAAKKSRKARKGSASYLGLA
ncbi:MAG TPA: chromate resistance protein ChrB domain-containing protein [Candidatus Acidoferrales bacterium]|nr:chromate resistance protein ChrB domain-containing protein [Candidatus Acidoferrales bacterium]